MRSFLLLVCLTLLAQPLFSQSVPYGSNPVAGQYQSVNGIKLYYETHGQGPPLLLIHGNGGTLSDFSKNMPYFSKNYRVIAVDSRAHGKSIDPGDTLTFEQMADDFAAFLTNLRVDSAYVVGWSDGGINALLLAMRHPEKVRKLVATGANLTPDSTALIPSLWQQMQKGYRDQGNKPFPDAKARNDWKVFKLDLFQPNIPFGALKAVRCPALIVAGDRDVIVTEHTVNIWRHIPGAALWILPNCGHATLIDRADEFNQKVADFFRGK